MDFQALSASLFCLVLTWITFNMKWISHFTSSEEVFSPGNTIFVRGKLFFKGGHVSTMEDNSMLFNGSQGLAEAIISEVRCSWTMLMQNVFEPPSCLGGEKWGGGSFSLSTHVCSGLLSVTCHGHVSLLLQAALSRNAAALCVISEWWLVSAAPYGSAWASILKLWDLLALCMETVQAISTNPPASVPSQPGWTSFRNSFFFFCFNHSGNGFIKQMTSG